MDVSFVVIFLFCALSLLPQPVRAQTGTTTIPVGVDPQAMAITPNGEYVYVVNNGGTDSNPSVSVISTATNTVIATIPVGSYPESVAVTPNGEYAYVSK